MTLSAILPYLISLGLIGDGDSPVKFERGKDHVSIRIGGSRSPPTSGTIPRSNAPTSHTSAPPRVSKSLGPSRPSKGGTPPITPRCTPVSG